MLNINIICDDDYCTEFESIDLQLQDRVIDLASAKNYVADSFGWTFGEYKDAGNNPMVLCKGCTAKRETADENTQVQN